MNIPGLVNDLRTVADMLERIAGIFSPTAQIEPAPVLLSAPAAVAAALPSKPRGKVAKRAGKQAHRKAAQTKVGAPKRGGRVWTDARKDLLRRDWPGGVVTGDIRAALNRLPGPSIPDNGRVAVAAGQLGLHRPASGRQARTPPSEDALPAASPVREVVASIPSVVVPVRPIVAAPPPAAPPPRPARRPPSPLASRDGAPSVALRELAEARAAEGDAPVTWAVAMTWAQRNHVQLGGTEEQDLAATNRARLNAQLPPYRIIAQRGRAEPLPDPRLGGNVESAAA